MPSVNIAKLKNYLKKLEESSNWYSTDFFSFVDEVSEYLGISLGEQYKQNFLNLVVKGETAGYNRSIGKMRSHLAALLDSLEPQFEKANLKEQAENLHSTQVNQQVVASLSAEAFENHVVKKENNQVFIVHGHDNEAKETVARFVEKLGLRAVILHEQPNHGRTIIEKFEEFSEKISFAIVLLTPDDFGAPKSDLKNPKPRARQNVIYELGFFNAKLSRSKVFVLKKGNVEILSDYLGVIYEEMDEKGSWKNKLVGELEEVKIFISPENLKKALLS
jgi:predicted nucleotide-binding protein